jgi:hypothetical protein
MIVTQRSGRDSRYSDAPTRQPQPQQLDYGVVVRDVTPPSSPYRAGSPGSRWRRWCSRFFKDIENADTAVAAV